MRLEKDRLNKKQKRAKKVSQPQHEILNQQDYLNMFDKPIMVVLKSNVGLRLTLISSISLCNTLSGSVQYVMRHGP
jgi:hypothetical protein